jgi:phosphoenolpyruvate carboxykinase (GTP)
MFELKKGKDILTELGGINSQQEADQVFKNSMDDANFAKIQKIKNEEARLKIANAIVLGKPDNVFINNGSAEDVKWVIDLSLKRGEEDTLAIKDHYIHYDLADEQARIVDRTFYIANDDELVSSLAKRMSREDAFEYIEKYMVGMMKGMTLVVGFYSRGPVGAAATIPAIEATTSTYVCHSAELLYRNCFDQFDAEADRVGHFFTNVHSQGLNRPDDLPNARVLMDRSHQTTYSTYCTYAGNTLLLKKGNHRFAVDRAPITAAAGNCPSICLLPAFRGPAAG